MSLTSSLVSNNNITKPSLTIAQIIQSHITKCPTPATPGLGVKVNHNDGSKELVSLLHEHGLIVPYDDFKRFIISAAKYIREHDHIKNGLRKNFTPIHSWIDNYDLAGFTHNGHRETYAVAIELMQLTDEDNSSIKFHRLSKAEMKRVKCSELYAVTFEYYQGH